jgi:predicted ATPase
MKSEPELIFEVQAGITEQLGREEADALIHLVPELQELISNTFLDSSMIHIGADEIDNRLERLRFAFRVLTRVFSASFSPVFLFLDDLQWLDMSSLQILDFLISDTQNDNALMIIGCYTSEVVGENSLLHNKVVSLREKTETYKFHMTEMTIKRRDCKGHSKHHTRLQYSKRCRPFGFGSEEDQR